MTTAVATRTTVGPSGSRSFLERYLPPGPVPAAAAAAALGAALVGASTGSLPAAGIVLVGGFLLPLVVFEPWWALAMLIVIQFTSSDDVLAAHGFEGGFFISLLLAAACLGLNFVRGRVRLVWSPVFLAAGLFLASRALSVLVARDTSLAMEQVVETAADLIFLFVFVTLLASSTKRVSLIGVAVLAVALLAVLSVVQEFVYGNTTDFFGYSNVLVEEELGAAVARHSGPQADANYWARTLLLLLPFALALWGNRVAGWKRWMWLPVAAAIFAGIYLTESRGGFLALGVGLAVWVLLSRRLIRALLVAPLIAAVVLTLPGFGSRIATLGTLDEAAAGAGDPSLIGRVRAAEAATVMFSENPVLGVGPGNFLLAVADYPNRPPAGLGPHNIYLEIASEQGIIGLLAWALLYGTALFLAARAFLLARHLAQGEDCWGKVLAIGVISGLVGWAAASAFLGLAYIKGPLIVIGLAAVLDIEARRASNASGLRHSERNE